MILGLGNILLKDEGIGAHIAGRLQKLALPCNVEVIDGGTAGLDILLFILRSNATENGSQEDLYKLVVIDAVRAGKEPGTIYKARLKGQETGELTRILAQGKDAKISLHQVGLIDALAVAEKMNRAPEEIVIIGIEPGEVNCGLELTKPVKRSIPQVIEKVLEEIDPVRNFTIGRKNSDFLTGTKKGNF